MQTPSGGRGGTVSGKVAAIGTFDGVHRGHVAVLDKLKETGRKYDLDPIAITFDRHPLELIARQRAPLAITGIARKEELIRKAGVTPVVIPFDEKLRATTARDWMKMLHDDMEVKALVVGYDNTFGSDGVTMSIGDYRKLGEEIGIAVTEAPYVEGISSSAIRKSISAGRVEEAADMLGRHYTLTGNVVRGNQLGRTIGFPTANLQPVPGLIIPGNGVYAAIATLPDGKKCQSVVNIGVRPTVMRGTTMTIEAHLAGWEGDLYGKPLKLTFYARLRDEMRFNSIDALRSQIEKDTEKAKLFLSHATKQGK